MVQLINERTAVRAFLESAGESEAILQLKREKSELQTKLDQADPRAGMDVLSRMNCRRSVSSLWSVQKLQIQEVKSKMSLRYLRNINLAD